MANWTGAFRSNYFKVKDLEKFKEFVSALLSEDDISVLENADHPGEVGLGCYSSTPSCLDDEKTGEAPDFYDELAKHLEPGSIAVFQEAGHEKLRYVSGWSTAVSSEGTIAKVSLDDIYEELAQLGLEDVSQCEY
jgi:hypothetical protein